MIQKFTQLSVLASIVLVCCSWFTNSVNAQTFTNPAAITINTIGAATPSPSNIVVTGGPASISVVSVTINNFSHTWYNDVDILLVAPNGQSLVLLSDVGNDFFGTTGVTNVTYTFADFGNPISDVTLQYPSGTYQPVNNGAGDAFTGFTGAIGNSAPAGTNTFASVFGGDAANGTWSLFIQDDVGGDGGSIAGGWSITFAQPISGCTNSNACNYDPLATENDGSCVFPGCTDSGAVNFDPAAGCDDGSCCFDQIVTLNMFDDFGGWDGAEATIIDASNGQEMGTASLASGTSGVATFCLPDGCYIISITAGNWPGEVSWEIVTDQGSVTGGAPESGAVFGVGASVCIAGCTDPAATNYDPSATIDDGSCVSCPPGQQVAVFNMFDDVGDGWDGAQYFITNAGGAIVAQGTLDAGAEGTDLFCLAQGCYSLTVTAGTWPGEVSWTLTTTTGTIISQGAEPDGSSQAFAWAGATGCTIPGCTDPGCNNYNPQANEDDGSCICPPANDDCADAVDVGCGVTVTGTTIGANADAAAGTCQGVDNTSPGVWYRLIGTGDQVNLSTCGTAVDTKIHVYAGSCNSLSCVAANDDGPNPPCAGFSSQLLFTSLPGVSYYIMVSEFGDGVGVDFELAVTCIECAGAPINDACATAFPLPDGAEVSSSLCCANSDDISDVNAFATGYGVWYTMNSGDFDTFDFNLTNVSGANAALIVFEAANGDCSALDVIAACGPVVGTCAGSLYEANIPIQQNTDYYFLVYTTNAGGCGEFTLNADLTGVGCTDPLASNFDPINTIEDGSCIYTGPPANDLCADAITLTCGSNTIGTTALSTNAGVPTACGISNGDTGVWYTFVGDGQVITLNSCGSAIDTRLEVVSSANGCAGPFTCVVGEDDDATDAGCGFFDGDDAAVTFVSEVGVTYYIYVSAGAVDTNGDFQDDLFDGAFSLDFQCAPLVEGCTDDCACNYNPDANQDDNSCEYFSCAGCAAGQTAFIFQMEDDFGDGWNGAVYTIEDLAGNVVATGSLNDAQCSQDLDANVGADFGFDILCLEDGCYRISVTAGTWPGEVIWSLEDQNGNEIIAGGAPETDVTFTIGAGVCGCTDDTACNFDPAATDDDGSCEFTSCAGCTDNTACNFDPNAQISNPAECCYDNCLTFVMTDAFGDGWTNNVAVITNLSTGEIVGTATLPAATSNGTASFCVPDGCYRLTVGGGSFPQDVSWILTGTNSGVLSGGVNTNGIQFSVGSGNCTPGCLEPFACNYDPEAGLSDCSLCEYTSCQGCTYEQAENYDPAALIDDGSCIIIGGSSCPADVNSDGVVGVADLLEVLNQFGSTCPN
jgi:subtilisin-like proprotein convertase family protein